MHFSINQEKTKHGYLQIIIKPTLCVKNYLYNDLLLKISTKGDRNPVTLKLTNDDFKKYLFIDVSEKKEF